MSRWSYSDTSSGAEVETLLWVQVSLEKQLWCCWWFSKLITNDTFASLQNYCWFTLIFFRRKKKKEVISKRAVSFSEARNMKYEPSLNSSRDHCIHFSIKYSWKIYVSSSSLPSHALNSRLAPRHIWQPVKCILSYMVIFGHFEVV